MELAVEKKLLRLKKRILKELHREECDFSFHLISDREMESLRSQLISRRDFKGREAKKIAQEDMVDVLAFPEPEGFPHPETKKIWLGEIYLNSKAGSGSSDRLSFLMVHGFLHLLGYRHWEVRDIMKMESLEKTLCEKLKISTDN